MYSERLKTLTKAYNVIAKNNRLYVDAQTEVALRAEQVKLAQNLEEQLKTLTLQITTDESLWREGILSILENEISQDLAYVYPTDGYNINLTSRVLRGKIHIDAKVTSTFSASMPGRIQKTQGRLFQQIVSFSALEGVMSLLGIKTIYVDEAFSGSSKKNVEKLNSLLQALQQRGYNLIIIAQDTTIADGLDANRIFLTRSVDNKTALSQRVGVTHGE